MSFFKYHNYNTSDVNINFTYAHNGKIFHAGRKNEEGIITVLKENGSLLWNKTYSMPERHIVFKKITPFQTGYLLTGLENGSIPFILRIDEDGEFIWYKSFPDAVVKNALFLETLENLIFLVYLNEENRRSYILSLDEEGNVSKKKEISVYGGDAGFEVEGFTRYSETLAICGNQVLKEEKQGFLFRLDPMLNILDAKYSFLFDSVTPITLDGVYYANNKLYVSGLWIDKPVLMLADEQWGAYYLLNVNKKTSFTFGPDYFYVYNDKNEIVHSTYDFVHQFVKQLDVTTMAMDQIVNTNVLIRGTIGSTNYSGYIDQAIDNCKSFPIEFWRSSVFEQKMEDTALQLIDMPYKIEKNDIKVVPASYTGEDVCDTGGGTSIVFNEFSGLQTPNFYLQGAGSRGEDSAKGIHLRWSFGGKLGENHLPKGNLASTAYNFNKPDDFVRIYRTPYVKSVFTLDFSVAPQLVDDNQKMWVYKANGNTRMIYVYFKNKAVYNQVKQIINPLIEPLKFVEKYGNEIIEVQCKTDLFFAARLKVNNYQSSSYLEVEALSVSENNSVSQQHLTYRKPYSGNEIGDAYFNAENGKTLRFRATDCYTQVIEFEFYSDFIISRNNANAWKLQGEFSLTTNDHEVFDRLEPQPDTNPVNGKWLRYNDGAYTNVDNYMKKWEHPSQGPLDRDIFTVVKNYVALSDAQPNPKAYETIDFNFAPSGTDPFVDITNDPPEDGETQVSNLDMLNIAALDYHVARMLGLGHLDIKDDTFGSEFIYIAEYYTNKNVDINSSDKSYQLLSMSLPVSTEIERLSLPVNLMKLSKGMDSNNPNSANLYNSEGYSSDGKYRYISVYNNQIPDFQVNPTFFESYVKFDASSFTNPVYAGLEYRLVEPGETDDYIWVKPELSHDTQYKNIDNTSNGGDSFETLPIQIPDTYVPLYMHKQDKSGTYYYKGYGINWFSRAQLGETELSIDTEIKPANKLLPPSGTTAFNIQKEFPPTFTTQDDQKRLKAITDTDKTLVRLTYDYHIYQDGIGYSIPFDSPLSNDDYMDPNTLFPDNKEVFADEVEIYFRNYTPKIISAQAFAVEAHPANQLLAVIKTKDYVVPGSGATLGNVPGGPQPQPSIQQETFKSEIPAGTTINDFIGSIFLMGSDSYIINGITQAPAGLVFTVFKKAASEAIIAGTTPLIDQASLTLPVINPSTEGLFNVTENMQNTSTWGTKNPNSLKVKIGTNDWSVHREIISMPQANGTPQRYLEKSRGFWKQATVEKYFEKITKYQNSLGTVIDYPDTQPFVHQGVYKITFPGFKMAQHPQFFSNLNSVEWLNGIVRMFTNLDYNNGEPTESRSIFKVVRTENIGTNNDLVLYVYDENFEVIEDDVTHLPKFLEVGNTDPKLTDPVTGTDVKVNYYPSYKVYLYKNVANNLIEDAILPSGDEDVRYSVFGFKSVDNDTLDMQGAKYKSKFSIPTVLFANRIVEPYPPKQPTGSKYATRPDKFGKSTYSFITEFTHKPYATQYFRANNGLLLAALYEQETIKNIKQNLNALGGTDEVFFNDRWMNFVDFDMLTNNVSTEYALLPDVGPLQYKLPLPDSEHFFDEINAFIEEHNDFYDLLPGTAYYNDKLVEADRGHKKFNQIIIKAIPTISDELSFGQFIKERIFNCFLPLTEVPMIYQHIKNLSFTDPLGHRPKNKKQTIRDAAGYLLPTTHADFDMAPMAAVYSQAPNHSTLFTDFALDGASDNFYFYGVREMGNQMQMGEFSTFLGPIKLVNTNPAEPAKILSLLPVVDNATLGISAGVRVEINPYPEVHKINKVTLYRATNKLDADSILSMEMIKDLDIADVEIDANNGSWVIYDDFEGFETKPYGDLLFYRVVVSRKVEYSVTNYFVNPPVSEVVVEQAPSLPSKVFVSTLVENYNPPAPELRYHSEPVVSDFIDTVILSWDQVCYKGKYHLYKLNNQGNWKEIARINTDAKDISKANLYLLENNPVTNIEEWKLKETFDLTVNEFFLPLEKLNMDPMQIKDADGNMLYHHFKMVSENTSNMISTEEKILTIYKEETWSDIGGISSNGLDGMILQGTFIVRPNI
ncbi:hypothetical protein [Chryseobacterium tongliaoense]|uniref:hypothetical protein n=1 Tax=Chryseobacterium tongliaoense TaxID=3240933 RepID=UPI00351373E9